MIVNPALFQQMSMNSHMKQIMLDLQQSLGEKKSLKGFSKNTKFLQSTQDQKGDS